METDRALIGALIFIGLIVVSNFVMYAIARGAVKGGDSRWMSALRDAFKKPMESSSNQSMDELRKKVDALKKEKKEE